MARVSVIVPVYNEAPYLRWCLDSIMAQTRRPDEVLVLVDEKTTDGSLSIASGHPLRPQVLLGLKDTFTLQHRGVLKASGDIVVNVDGDTYIAPDWIERALVFLSNPSVVLVTGHIAPHIQNATNEWICAYQNGNSGYLSGCSSAMRKSDYLRLCDMLGGPRNIEFAYYPFEKLGDVVKSPAMLAETDIPTTKQKLLFLGAGGALAGALATLAVVSRKRK